MTGTVTAARRDSPLPAVLRSEWIKLRTVRSTYIAVAAALLLGLGLGLLDVLSVTGHWATMKAADRAAFDPVETRSAASSSASSPSVPSACWRSAPSTRPA